MKDKTENIVGLREMSLGRIARLIAMHWDNMSPHAAPYAEAMLSLDKITDNYYADSGRSVVAYFLGNAHSWRGPIAREIKAELNRRLK